MKDQKVIIIRSLTRIQKHNPGLLLEVTVSSFLEIKSELFVELQITEELYFYSKNGFQLFDDDFTYLSNKDIIYAIPINIQFPVNEYIKEFTVIKELGRGGFGVILLVSFNINNEYRALKKIYNSCLLTSQQADIMKEARTLQKLNHPNIIKIYNAFFSGGCLYLFMEYVKAGDLAKYIKTRNGIKEEEAKIIFNQLLNATNYIHENKIVHKDLKLENILLTDEKELSIKIIDFGISGLVDESSNAGTLKYLAPEVVLISAFLKNVITHHLKMYGH